MNSLSYTSAGLFPWKLLKQPHLLNKISNEGVIIPIHAQFIPTNRCNLNCPMCSCGKRDPKLEMSFADACTIIGSLEQLGCKVVTITGGGEPVLHPHFSGIVEQFWERGIALGMATNGLMLRTVSVQTLSRFTWIRISNDDSREFTSEYENQLITTIAKASTVDWAFSHVVAKEPNFKEIRRVVRFANEHDFTHVRLVSDLFDVEDVCLQDVEINLREYSIPMDRVIFQGRKEFVQGGDCRIGYLKPLIGPDCKVYACCGVQYALDPPSYDLPEELCIGDALKLREMYQGKQKPMDGSVCSVCYYSAYNEAIANMLEPLEHVDFV